MTRLEWQISKVKHEKMVLHAFWLFISFGGCPIRVLHRDIARGKMYLCSFFLTQHTQVCLCSQRRCLYFKLPIWVHVCVCVCVCRLRVSAVNQAELETFESLSEKSWCLIFLRKLKFSFSCFHWIFLESFKVEVYCHFRHYLFPLCFVICVWHGK